MLNSANGENMNIKETYKAEILLTDRLKNAKCLEDLIVWNSRLTHGANRGKRAEHNPVAPIADDKRENLIEALQNNDFTTYVELAKRVGVSRFVVSAYAKRLGKMSILSKKRAGEV